jgi:hypothetical protein
MSTEVAEAEPADSAPFQRAARPADHSSAGEVGRRGSAARGIMIAVLISFPLWVLLGVAIYLFA